MDCWRSANESDTKEKENKSNDDSSQEVEQHELLEGGQASAPMAPLDVEGVTPNDAENGVATYM
jgi:hypothetical protein